MAENNASTNDDAVLCVRALIENFHPVETFGTILAIDSKDIPAPFYSLLAHHSHMTVAMEAFHGHSVSLEVVSVAPDETDGQTSYTREILLRSPVFNDKAFGLTTRSDKNQKKRIASSSTVLSELIRIVCLRKW